MPRWQLVHRWPLDGSARAVLPWRLLCRGRGAADRLSRRAVRQRDGAVGRGVLGRVHARRLLSHWLDHRHAMRRGLLWQHDRAHVARRLPHLPRRPRLLTRRGGTDAVRRRQRLSRPGRIGLHSMHRRLLPGRSGPEQLCPMHAWRVVRGGRRLPESMRTRKLRGDARQLQRDRVPAVPDWPRMRTGRRGTQGMRRRLGRSKRELRRVRALRQRHLPRRHGRAGV